MRENNTPLMSEQQKTQMLNYQQPDVMFNANSTGSEVEYLPGNIEVLVPTEEVRDEIRARKSTYRIYDL